MHKKVYRLIRIKEELQPVEKAFLEHIQNKDELNPPQKKVIDLKEPGLRIKGVKQKKKKKKKKKKD